MWWNVRPAPGAERAVLRDRHLVHRVRRGDVEALQQIYQRYKDDLLTVAMSLLGDTQGAEDCMHDVFVHFAEAPADLRVNRSLRGYLIRCVANRAKNVLKGRQRPPEPPTDEPEGIDCPIRDSMASEESKQVFDALAQLPPEQREVITLHIHGQMRFREIADQLELSINTVQSRYRYGIEKLRTLL
jgi:RNA polymerase sigma-70 factor (ECF subfamily)